MDILLSTKLTALTLSSHPKLHQTQANLPPPILPQPSNKPPIPLNHLSNQKLHVTQRSLLNLDLVASPIYRPRTIRARVRAAHGSRSLRQLNALRSRSSIKRSARRYTAVDRLRTPAAAFNNKAVNSREDPPRRADRSVVGSPPRTMDPRGNYEDRCIYRADA